MIGLGSDKKNTLYVLLFYHTTALIFLFPQDRSAAGVRVVSHVLSKGIGLWRGGHWTGRVEWRNFVEGGARGILEVEK